MRQNPLVLDPVSQKYPKAFYTLMKIQPSAYKKALKRHIALSQPLRLLVPEWGQGQVEIGREGGR